MRRVIPAVLLLLVAVIALIHPETAEACSPMPWTFEQAASGSKAIVLGEVASVRQAGREAVVDVTVYVGPGEAPRAIHLPATVDSRSGNDGCPDFSMKFRTGETYVFFLGDISPRLKLAYPQWITAFSVDANGRVVVNERGETDSADGRLSAFAANRHYAVSCPGPNSPVWGKSSSAIAWVLTSILLVVAAVWLWSLWHTRSSSRNR